MKKRLLSLITICILSFLLLSKNTYSQNLSECKKWAFSITIFPEMKANTDLTDSVIYSLFQRSRNSPDKRMAFYFSFISFNDNGKLYLNYFFDSASALLAGIDVGNKKDQKVSLQIDFDSNTLTGDSIYKLDEKLKFIKDTIVNNKNVYMYYYDDYKIFTDAKITSIEKNFLSADSKFVEIFKNSFCYRLELTDNNYHCDKTAIKEMFKSSGVKSISGKKMEVMEYFLFNK